MPSLIRIIDGIMACLHWLELSMGLSIVSKYVELWRYRALFQIWNGNKNADVHVLGSGRWLRLIIHQLTLLPIISCSYTKIISCSGDLMVLLAYATNKLCSAPWYSPTKKISKPEAVSFEHCKQNNISCDKNSLSDYPQQNPNNHFMLVFHIPN